jgi:hypothetical protein
VYSRAYLSIGLILLASTGCAGRHTAATIPSAGAVGPGPAAKFKVPDRLLLPIPPPPPRMTPRKPDVHGRATLTVHATFFAGEAPLSNGVFYLGLPNGNPFGYYSYLPDANYIYHFDMGYLYVVDANDGKGGVYFYDFSSSHWWYTGRSYPFPYIYDFSLSAFIYYYPSSAPGHYTANPRYFYNFGTSGIIVMPGVIGVAATGQPLAATTVTLKDSSGAAKSAVTGSDGSYAIDTTGMTGPFMEQVTTPGNVKLYSVSADANAAMTVNVTPLTDVAVRMWYGVQNVAVDAAFGAPTGTNAAPSPASVSVLTNLVKNIVQLWLAKAAVPASGFSPITTPFAADGTGLDHVLSQTSVNQGTGHVTITDGTTTQNTGLTYAGSNVTVATTTTGAGGTSSSSTTTVIPVSGGQQSAQSAIIAQLNAFALLVTSKGIALQASDLMPFLDASLLNDGLNRTQYATQFVSQAAGAVLSFGAPQFKALDTAAGTADLLVTGSITQGGQTRTQPLEFFFKSSGATWLIAGDRRPGAIGLSAEARTNQGAFAGTGSGPDINGDVQSPQGNLTGITITGGGIWNGTSLSKGATAVQGSLLLDHYFVNSGVLGQAVSAGTPFTFAFQGAGNPANVTINLNSFTSELIHITSPTSSSIAAANVGSLLTVNWTLPATYPIAMVKFSVQAYNGNQTNPATLQCEVEVPVGPTATSALPSIPSICGGAPVVEVNLNLTVIGVNGEQSVVVYAMK